MDSNKSTKEITLSIGAMLVINFVQETQWFKLNDFLNHIIKILTIDYYIIKPKHL